MHNHITLVKVDQALGSVPSHGTAHLPARHDPAPESAVPSSAKQDQNQIPGAVTLAELIHLLKLGTPT